MNNDNEPNLPTPKSTLDQLKEWQELIGYIAAGLASGLGIFLSSGAAQIASTVLAAVVVAGGTWHVRRSYRRKKQREEQERLWEERRKQPRAAFRSLSPFEEQDELPGQDSKQQARSIAVRIVNDDFRFGIVCGDSGAGKTSLLRSEVMRQIRANGLEPVYLRSPRRLAGTASANATGCERLAAELDAFAQERIPADTCVLILDQFEEWFVEYREPEARALLGRFIARLTRRVPPVRVVCAVRREFLMDFHDLAAELPDPTQPNNTFRVRNFTVAQAVDAVQQCAAADGLAAEDSFATTLAADLEDNGEVRPPELQIVCTHLAESGSLSSDRYQAEGGTAGILAHYIKNALESCREPETGAKLLRSLCDFPTRTKRPPKTLAALAADIGRTAESATVAGLVRTFVLARLLVEEKRKGSPDAYGLLHDYLVGAVELATGDVSTQTEEANQLLRYHLAQQRGVIPLRRLRFIRAHADRPLLAQPKARQLVRKSLIAPAVLSGAMVCVAVLIAGGVYLMATAQVQWPVKVIGRHCEENEAGGQWADYKVLHDNRTVISSSYGKNLYFYINFWDIISGNVYFKTKEDTTPVSFSSNNSLILIQERFKRSKVINSSSLKEIFIPRYNCNISNNEKYILCTKDKVENVSSAEIWLLDKGDLSYMVNNIPGVNLGNIKFSDNGERVIVLNDGKLSIYNAISNKKIREISIAGNNIINFTIDSSANMIITISEPNLAPRISSIHLWSLDDASLLMTNKLNTRTIENIQITKGCKFITFISNDKLNMLSFIDLKYINQEHSMKYSNNKTITRPVAYWTEGLDVLFFDINNGTVSVIQNVGIKNNDHLVSNNDFQRAVIWGPQRPAELWDLKEKKRICLLTSQKNNLIQSIEFSMNDTAVVIQEEGNVASLFAARDGAPLAQHISAASVYYYDPELRRIHAWNSSGQVLRYVEGRSYFGKFVPTKKGALD